MTEMTLWEAERQQRLLEQAIAWDFWSQGVLAAVLPLTAVACAYAVYRAVKSGSQEMFPVFLFGLIGVVVSLLVFPVNAYYALKLAVAPDVYVSQYLSEYEIQRPEPETGECYRVPKEDYHKLLDENHALKGRVDGLFRRNRDLQRMLDDAVSGVAIAEKP